MKEMYQNYESGEEEWDLPPVCTYIGFKTLKFSIKYLIQDRDPFLEDPNLECHIGTVQVYLQSLAFMIELKEQLSINDYSGTEVGIINVEIVPCDEVGNEYDERDDVYVDSPHELLGRSIHFVVKINGCRGLPSRFTVDINSINKLIFYGSNGCVVSTIFRTFTLNSEYFSMKRTPELIPCLTHRIQTLILRKYLRLEK